MMKKYLLALACLVAMTAGAAGKKKELLPYQNPALGIEERLHDLMQRMTLEEKVGQLRCTMAWNYYDIVKRPTAAPRKNRGHRNLSRTDSLPNWQRWRAMHCRSM